MLKNLQEYGIHLDVNGKLDYSLIVVHVPKIKYELLRDKEYIKADKEYIQSQQQLSPHISAIALEASQRFGNKTLELVHPLWDISSIYSRHLEDIACEIQSYSGEINKEYVEQFGLGTTIKYVVLTGREYGDCHAKTFHELIIHGIKEIHLPEDCIEGHGINDSLDITKTLDFEKYVPKKRGSYQIFVPGKSEPVLEKISNKEKENPLLVIFHTSWEAMMDFFDSRIKP